MLLARAVERQVGTMALRWSIKNFITLMVRIDENDPGEPAFEIHELISQTQANP